MKKKVLIMPLNLLMIGYALSDGISPKSPKSPKSSSHFNYCNNFNCGADCNGNCGWSSLFNKCLWGFHTSLHEINQGPGCLTTTQSNINSLNTTTTEFFHNSTDTIYNTLMTYTTISSKTSKTSYTPYTIKNLVNYSNLNEETNNLPIQNNKIIIIVSTIAFFTIVLIILYIKKKRNMYANNNLNVDNEHQNNVDNIIFNYSNNNENYNYDNKSDNSEYLEPTIQNNIKSPPLYEVIDEIYENQQTHLYNLADSIAINPHIYDKSSNLEINQYDSAN